MKKSTRSTKVAAAAVLTMTVVGGARALAMEPYVGSRFSEVWGEAKSTPYAGLPRTRVTLGSFFYWGRNVLRDAAFRTVSDKNDLLPRFDKLVHPNGVCLSGTWNMTEPSPYTGYFAAGSKGLVIARASVALSDTLQGDYRGFGLTGKIYPTADPNHEAPLKTANFFVIDDLGGTLTEHYTDAVMTNEPAATVRWQTALELGPIGAAAKAAFRAADINPGIRQVYPIAELGLTDPSALRSPRYMLIQGAQGPRVDEPDFRDELDVSRYGSHLDFDVFVSEDKSEWSYLGFIAFTDSVASDSCDHRVHFTHPSYRTDLD